MVGHRCVWINYPKLDRLKPLQNRIYEILSVTLTHVYVINIRTRVRKNVAIKDFDKDYEIYSKHIPEEELQ